MLKLDHRLGMYYPRSEMGILNIHNFVKVPKETIHVLYYIERYIRNFVQVLETTYYPRNVYSKISTISVKVLKEAKFLAKYQSKR